jgi:HPt (histidine-containing phosphotransfer) domain-containing protein
VQKIREIQPNGRTTPVLALTAHALTEVKEKSMRAGFTDHLTKPIRRATLLDAIRRYAPAVPSGGKRVATVVSVDPSLSDLVPAFLEKRRLDAPRLAQALSAGDYETVRKIGHNLKGTGASYGFKFITEVGGRIEQAAKLRDAATISNNIGELTNYLSSIEWVTSGDSAEV